MVSRQQKVPRKTQNDDVIAADSSDRQSEREVGEGGGVQPACGRKTREKREESARKTGEKTAGREEGKREQRGKIGRGLGELAASSSQVE